MQTIKILMAPVDRALSNVLLGSALFNREASFPQAPGGLAMPKMGEPARTLTLAPRRTLMRSKRGAPVPSTANPR